VRFVAVTRLHCLSLFHLYRLLYHSRPVLLNTHAGAIPCMAHQTQDMSSYRLSDSVSLYSAGSTGLRCYIDKSVSKKVESLQILHYIYQNRECLDEKTVPHSPECNDVSSHEQATSFFVPSLPVECMLNRHATVSADSAVA